MKPLLVALPLLLATAAPAAPQPEGTATPETLLQLSNAGTRMAVPVQVAGSGPYPFIVDTGAERTVVSQELAAELKLPQGRAVRLTSMAGTQTVGTVRLPGFTVDRIAGGAVDAPALQAGFLGAPGLIGVDTLQDKAVVIDFEQGVMSVRPATRRRASPDNGDVVIKARNIYGQLVVTNALFDGHVVRVILDTGSELSVGNPALQRLMRLPRFDKVTLTSVTGEKLAADFAIGRELRVGGLVVRGLPMGFVDAAPFRRFGLEKQPALMLGMDALRLFRRVSIDFANRQLLFAVPAGTPQEATDEALRRIPLN